MDDDLDEMERRMDALEARVFGNIDTKVGSSMDASAWARAEKIAKSLSALEESLNPDAGSDFTPGAACLAYSIADNAWLDAVIEAKVAPRTYSITFEATGSSRQVSHDQLRAQMCDLHVVASAEEAVAALAAKHLPAGSSLREHVGGFSKSNGRSSSSWPLAVPMGPLAQKATALAAAKELDDSAAHLAALFGEPLNLAQHVDSSAVADVPNQASALVSSCSFLGVYSSSDVDVLGFQCSMREVTLGS